ncbi:ABC transporter permease [Methanocella arvoryzae]|uniref:ABC-type transport system, permease component n=1 Tax=Methanocella arvoryzae (strain DSM 22066 / NBRC 105507 / MRE50) TaxID=351160 RepID=Q0W634_METAR|nr:ABC transporter permease subunit [Methanocella arvoryzae]CAJ36159.1 putative ABC-type transport system, permease component [Methanocella arvoryzae MRE50]
MAAKETSPVLIVAAKEFKDYLASKRFLALFGVLALLTIIGAITGLINYNEQLSAYNDNLQTVKSDTAGVGGMVVRMIGGMPSLLSIFQSYGSYIASFGMLLAISMGFDMITREKEEGTLKLLLTHPVFRDSVINGKLLGAGAMLFMVLASTFLATIAIMMFFGIVPGIDDLARIGAFFMMTLLFLFTYLAIAVTASTISPNSSMAVLIAIFVVLIGAVIPGISSTVGSAIMGPAPVMMIPSTSGSTSGDSALPGSVFVGGPGGTTTVVTYAVSDGGPGGAPGINRNGTPMAINPEYTSYWSTRNTIEGIMNVISPSYNYEVISQVITEKLASPRTSGSNPGLFQRSADQSVSLMESLSSVWMNILALVVMIVVGFGISYVKFIRADVR